MVDKHGHLTVLRVHAALESYVTLTCGDKIGRFHELSTRPSPVRSTVRHVVASAGWRSLAVGPGIKRRFP
jgi:hypothetical protein